MRDAGLLSLEEAVHSLTGRTAEFFGLGDRGVVAPGKAGDLAVFTLDEIELGDEERRYDVPHGTWRSPARRRLPRHDRGRCTDVARRRRHRSAPGAPHPPGRLSYWGLDVTGSCSRLLSHPSIAVS